MRQCRVVFRPALIQPDFGSMTSSISKWEAMFALAPLIHAVNHLLIGLFLFFRIFDGLELLAIAKLTAPSSPMPPNSLVGQPTMK